VVEEAHITDRVARQRDAEHHVGPQQPDEDLESARGDGEDVAARVAIDEDDLARSYRRSLLAASRSFLGQRINQMVTAMQSFDDKEVATVRRIPHADARRHRRKAELR
jgi:hypothetical protein